MLRVYYIFTNKHFQALKQSSQIRYQNDRYNVTSKIKRSVWVLNHENFRDIECRPNAWIY